MKNNNSNLCIIRELLNYFSNFKQNDNFAMPINLNTVFTWNLISTSLLLSENLLKKTNIYHKFDKKQYVMLENILDKTLMDTDYQDLNSYFLDDENNELNPFHTLMPDTAELKKYLSEQELKFYQQYGSNSSIITNGYLDYKKLMIRIRNSIAHSNYEIIDDNYLRLYHYNEITNKLDFNVKINSIIILTVIDELNEFVAQHYEPFLKEYILRDANIQYSTEELKEEEIIKHMLSFGFLTEEECQEILKEAKNKKSYYANLKNENNYNKFSLIYDLIYKKIKPTTDYGIIINEIICEISENKNLSNYFYQKYGYYSYFNSELYESRDDYNKKQIQENKLKIIILALLKNLLLDNYNNQNLNYNKIDFIKMEIDLNIKTEYIKNKYKSIKLDFKNLSERERELKIIAESINRLENQLKNGNAQNEFLTKILPDRIKSLKEKYKITYSKYLSLKIEVQQKMYNKLFEVSDLESNINMNANISEDIIKHLRNSLAHGYIRFPQNFDLNNFLNSQICFEDYEKNDKEKLTFRGTITIIDLLVTMNNYFSNILPEEQEKTLI